MTARQEFITLQSYNGFELREYLPCVLAEVNVSAQFSEASSAAFGRLFKYISKGNKNSEKIAMTAPVIAAQKTDKGHSHEWFVSFVMPSGSALSQMPNPNDPQVRLREVGSEKCVALSFRGRTDEALSDMRVHELRQLAANENIALSDEVRICRFDPPFKPGFMHYNEIVIPLLDK